MIHNLEAESVSECDACIELVSDPTSTNELQAFALADAEHFRAILSDDRHARTRSIENHVKFFRLA